MKPPATVRVRLPAPPPPDTALQTVIVIAKQPRAGRVKTRLVPPLTPEQAATVAGAALRQTIATVAAVPSVHRLLAFDGDPHDWVPASWRVVTQPPGGLDDRLGAAFAAAGPGPAVLVGMDTPQVRPEQLTAFDPVRFDACFGPARDGGFWAIGFADPALAAGAIRGVAMSTDRTGERQLWRLCELGLRVQILDELVDVDTIEDARAVAELTPGAPFATALAGVAPWPDSST